ncbi:Hypothetical protein NCS54_01305100 [Fusarium falciforme]|uniref:Hypothetical protein n=1 Tax=Fusarium falciforme TaxID=195108 RepID=UPI002300F42E|nr:Hypothetical protein NCS54_01305100 [Fusarium falciforme]WAO95429.1 Hypothetical protein NCS54_01305100 [Fusarium falciforme]
MEVAAAAIAFAQGIGMITTGIRTLHSIRQAPVEFMDLLNHLSTLNGRAELLRRSLDSLAGVHSDVPDVDIDTIRNLQVQFEEISSQLNDTATNFIAKSKGLDSQGRHRIPRIMWQRQQSNLMGLRQRVKQLSSEMTDCLAAINTSQGVRQTGLVLDVRAVMEQSFTDIASQIQHGNTLTEQDHESINHIVQQNETQTALLHSTLANHQEIGATISRRLDVFETRVETQLSRVMENLSPDRHSNRASQGSQTRTQFGHTVISVSTTLRQTCPPNCRCQCHRTSYARTPEWLSSVMGSLFVQYKSLPILGIKKCDKPLCKSASQSSIQLQWCFPRWLVARALVASISWSSINDDGAALFLKIPRSIYGFAWLVTSSHDDRAFIQHYMDGTIRPTDILAEWGVNFLTVCIDQKYWQLLQILLDLGFDPRMKDLTGRCAIHWARQYELDGNSNWAPADVQVTLRQIAAMELEDTSPLTMIHQVIREDTTHSLDECIQIEPQHINTPDDVGFAPLHWAVWKEDMAAFQTLVKASANVNQQTSHVRETPLHFACMHHNVDMVQTLLDLGASISLVDRNKWTPLHYATNQIQGRQKEMDVVQILLDAHADPNCGDGEGSTPLHLLFDDEVVDLDHVAALARALIDAGADLEAKEIYGRTVLLWTCAFSCKNMPILIDLGANVKAVDDNGRNMLSNLVNNETDLEPSLFYPELLVGVNPDARHEDNETTLGVMATRVRDSINWRPLSLRVVVDMVDLILGTREANWAAGLFLGDLLGWTKDEYNESTTSDTDDDELHPSDGSGSGDWETMSEDDDEEEEEDNDDDNNNGNDEREWSDGENSITFHDARESLE